MSDRNDRHVRIAWINGSCPCCMGDLIDWIGPDDIVYHPAPIAEGVMVCGRCIGNNHCDDSYSGKMVSEIIMEAIVNG